MSPTTLNRYLTCGNLCEITLNVAPLGEKCRPTIKENVSVKSKSPYKSNHKDSKISFFNAEAKPKFGSFNFTITSDE